MKKQHSITATYLLIDRGSGCMMFHPRDSSSFSKIRCRTEPDGELSLYPNLESALHSLDHDANVFFEENPEYDLKNIKQFHCPKYKLPVFNEGLPAIVEVQDVTRILIYTEE